MKRVKRVCYACGVVSEAVTEDALRDAGWALREALMTMSVTPFMRALVWHCPRCALRAVVEKHAG